MKYSFTPFLIAIFLFSCGKEQSFSNPNNNNPQNSSNDPIPQFAVSTAKLAPAHKLLKQEISYSQTNPHIKNVKQFIYDHAQRCTEIKLGTIDSSLSNPVFNLKQTLRFNYEGSSLMPFSFSSVKTVFPDLSTTYYYFYNSLGRKIIDSVRLKNQNGQPADRVMHYQYDKDQVFITPVLTGFPMENNSLDTLSLLNRGNIEKLKSRFIKSTGDRIVEFIFTYDQSINPYNKLNIANSLYFESASLGIGYNVPVETHYMGVTTNNITSWTNETTTVSFKYLYDQSNYPVKKEMFLPGNSTSQLVTLFQY